MKKLYKLISIIYAIYCYENFELIAYCNKVIMAIISFNFFYNLL